MCIQIIWHPSNDAIWVLSSTCQKFSYVHPKSNYKVCIRSGNFTIYKQKQRTHPLQYKSVALLRGLSTSSFPSSFTPKKDFHDAWVSVIISSPYATRYSYECIFTYAETLNMQFKFHIVIIHIEYEFIIQSTYKRSLKTLK